MDIGRHHTHCQKAVTYRGQALPMTRDDKLLRETILAELKRRRNLLGKDDKPARSDPADHRRIARPIYPPSPPAPATSE